MEKKSQKGKAQVSSPKEIKPMIYADDHDALCLHPGLSVSSIVDIFTDRIREADCQRGVVWVLAEVDDICTDPSALLSLLKAFGNQDRIFFITLHDTTEAESERQSQRIQNV
ncbi:uncharacterized protein LOC111083566, partial [Limulus polyphemus]|uniref:Uncharacterized protein LOC111083566 n=1 Tax=Limulus polyphemus TaxID=6850 RepID=A0ABM1RWX4_LIMPO